MRENADEVLLRHILECQEELAAHQDAMQRLNVTVWHEHVTIRNSVLRTLQTLSESGQKLSPEAKAAMQEIPWREIGRFRNVLVHDYLGTLRYETVDIILRHKIPVLLEAVDSYLRKHYGNA